MSPVVRKLLFWLHLVAGVTAGGVIGFMALTGVVLAFEPQVTEWADRPSRRVEVGSERLALEGLVEKVKDARPDLKPSNVTLWADASSAVLVSESKAKGAYVNPYSGAVMELGAPRVRAFFGALRGLHRWLGAEGVWRDRAKVVTGAATTAFFFLGLSGLYLWWPRRWTGRALRPSLWFRRGVQGKARDWNWHNVIGFWCLPVLLVLSLSGMVIAYEWATQLLYTVTGSARPAPSSASPAPPGLPLASLDALALRVHERLPDWERIVLRLDSRPTVTAAVLSREMEHRFAPSQVSLDRGTAAVLRVEAFSDFSRGKKLRVWMRYLHTGEALGVPGQLAAAGASLGAGVLVWTGLALAFRRLALRGREAGQRVSPGSLVSE